MLISAVVPVLDEAESLPVLHTQLRSVADQHGYSLQIIFVDDGSRDGSWEAIQQLSASDQNTLGIRFRRNFGKAAALAAGFDASEGEIIITLDADLQDDPAEIPNLIAKLDQNLDVVSGWKKNRLDPWHKRYPSKVFNWLVGKLTGLHLHDHNCGLKAYRRDVIHEVRLYGELHRFVPVLADARGFRVGEIVVNHREREHGVSKYGFSRFLKGFLDLLTVKFITGFGQRPQHFLGVIGSVFLLLGGFVMMILAGEWCWTRLDSDITNNAHLHERAAMFYSIGLVILGGQFLSIGFLGEMVTAYMIKDTNHYSIAEHTTPEDAPSAECSNASSTSTSLD